MAELVTIGAKEILGSVQFLRDKGLTSERLAAEEEPIAG
jgi:hypothetical protein